MKRRSLPRLAPARAGASALRFPTSPRRRPAAEAARVDQVALSRWEDDGGRASPAGGNERRARALTNVGAAAVLDQIADLLEVQGANAFRANAYRNGARTLRELEPRVAVVFLEQGLEGLEALPGIGRSLALVIGQLLETGRSPLLQRLQGEAPAEALFASIPGLGAELSHRIHAELHIETLEELEAAAHDGRLQRLPGFGPRRARAVREVLASRLATSARSRTRGPEPIRSAERPGVGTLLEIDAEYRTRAARGELRRIAPRRFNPTQTAWLPILHVDRDGWAFTALFSNTARAHRLGRTTDWVVVFYECDGIEGQCTLVSETRGTLAGRRVVRGREDECRAHYRAARPSRAHESSTVHAGDSRRRASEIGQR